MMNFGCSGGFLSMDEEISDKSRLVTFLLALVLGFLGGHRFYVGKKWTGLLTILTFFGFFGLWPLIDMILIAIGQFYDKEGKRIFKWVERDSM
jgi:TM2 domain-containing membrane protein YozV